MPRLMAACALCVSMAFTCSAKPIEETPPQPGSEQANALPMSVQIDADEDKTIPQEEVEVRLLGGDKKEPLAGVEIELTSGYGEMQKTFGPFKTNSEGTIKVRLPQGFYTLHLASEKEWPYLPVEKFWDKQSRGPTPSLNLLITDSGAEKWLEGKRRDADVEPSKPDDVPHITYTLLPACELVLRAVDADTGQGLPGAEFYEENAVGEEWAHPIDGENLGSSFAPNNGQIAAEANRTNKDGNFRRLIGANAGFKYGVEHAPAGYKEVKPRLEVEIDIPYGKTHAEHVFKFRRVLNHESACLQPMR